jgi:hypothetical protein
MRNVSFDDIMKTAIDLSVSFMPAADGSIVFSNETYLERGANGSFAHVPAFLTNVNNEGSLFVEPYSSLFPKGTTEQEASDGLSCPTGKFTRLRWTIDVNHAVRSDRSIR